MEARGTAQTEARANLWVPAKPEHAKIGWTYDFEQTERISRAAYDSTGYDATMEVVEFVMAEADRRHATALAAKAAELAEARKALDLFEHYGCPICHGDCASANPPVDCCPMEAARRAREAQGGENG